MIVRARKRVDIPAQRKIDEARRLTSKQRWLIAFKLSDAVAAALHLAGAKKKAQTPWAQDSSVLSLSSIQSSYPLLWVL
jgi:hypothetical protein